MRYRVVHGLATDSHGGIPHGAGAPRDDAAARDGSHHRGSGDALAIEHDGHRAAYVVSGELLEGVFPGRQEFEGDGPLARIGARRGVGLVGEI